jgi:hypothetical protein
MPTDKNDECTTVYLLANWVKSNQSSNKSLQAIAPLRLILKTLVF